MDQMRGFAALSDDGSKGIKMPFVKSQACEKNGKYACVISHLWMASGKALH
jgi:hypothetical protein